MAASQHSAFWDTSALVPLCVGQSLTPRAVALYKTYELVVWWATPVEISSALARLARAKHLGSKDWMKARTLAKRLENEWSMIQPSESLRKRAIELVSRYDLRAADALQLAAAMEWSQGTPQVFLTADQRLRAAALAQGFDAKTV